MTRAAKNWIAWALATLAVAGGAAGCGDTVHAARCEAGTRIACACTSGDAGEQACQGDGTLSECKCSLRGGDSGASNAGANPGSNASNAGQGSPAGGQSLQGGASNAAAGVGGEAPPMTQGGAVEGGAHSEGGVGGECASPEAEWCDGIDNNCDGEIDNGGVCPDDTVANTEPFTQGAYLLGTIQPGASDRDAVKRFWPTTAEGFRGPIQGSSNFYNFRPTDGALFYASNFSGLFEYIEGGPDVFVFTPPCARGVYGQPWFDGVGTPYYWCNATVRRGNGMLVHKDVSLFGVLDDGRAIVTESSRAPDQQDFVVLTPSGKEVSRLNPRPELAGSFVPDWGSSTVSGNHAYVAFLRSFGQQQQEFVVYRVDENSVWQRVRRLAMPDFGVARLAVSDGTVFVQTVEDTSFIITAHQPDLTQVVAWREVDQSQIHFFGRAQLLVGPR